MGILDDLAAFSTLTDVASGARPICLRCGCGEGGNWARLLKQYGIKVWMPTPDPRGCILLVKRGQVSRATGILRKHKAPI